MVVYPLITLGVLKLVALIPIADADKILLISYLASITPVASTVMQFAQIHDLDAEYATAINIFTTVACVLTMPLFVMLYSWI
jgi:predicted permease